jgi:hypothetical protein
MSAYLAMRSADFSGEGVLVVNFIFRYYWKYG